jgi:hypothetical protein
MQGLHDENTLNLPSLVNGDRAFPLSITKHVIRCIGFYITSTEVTFLAST